MIDPAKRNREYKLGVPAATLVGWIDDHKKDSQAAFSGKGHVKLADAEVAQSRKELGIVKEERDILKKALGIFSAIRK